MAKPVMMLAAAALAAAQSSEDYVMHAANVSGPFGGVCELCGELVCVPHLNFASVSAMVYDYAEFSCHGVALNINTESESAYVGEWTKLDRAPANVSSLALVKRGAIYRAFANGEEAQWFYHPSGSVPCNGSAPTAAEPEAANEWISRTDEPLDAAVRSLPGGGGDRRAAFGALEPSAFAVPTKGSEGPDAVFACDARGTALVPTDAAAPPARVLDAGCVQGLVGEGAGWRVFFVDATHSATPELYAATATNLSDAATYEIDGVVLRGDAGAWDAGGIASATDVVALANGSVALLYGSRGRAGLAVSDDGGRTSASCGEFREILGEESMRHRHRPAW